MADQLHGPDHGGRSEPSGLRCRLVNGVTGRGSSRSAPVASKLGAGGFLLGHGLPWPGDARLGGQPVELSSARSRPPRYLIGSSGSGKTTAILRQIDWEVAAWRTVVAIDLRGDAVNRILRRLAASKVDPARVSLIDLGEESFVTPLNFLAGAGPAYGRALSVLGVIRERAGGELSVQVEECLRCILMALAEGGGSVADVERFLADTAFRDDVLSRVTEQPVLDFAAKFEGLSPDRKALWQMPLGNKLAPYLAVPPIRRMLSADKCINVRRLLDEPGRILLVSLSVDTLHEAALLVGGMLIGEIQNAATGRVNVPEADRNPVSLIVDELEAVAPERFGTIIQEGRRFGLQLTAAHQAVCQLGKIGTLLRSNSAEKLLFNVGASDASELAAEVTDLPRDTARRMLVDLKVGECVAVRRGLPQALVKTINDSDPAVSDEAVASFRLAALRNAGTELTAADEKSDGTRPAAKIRHGMTSTPSPRQIVALSSSRHRPRAPR